MNIFKLNDISFTMDIPQLSALAVPAVLSLVSFLSFSSQFLFLYLEPLPLTRDESVKFNILILALLICYYRAVTTDPGDFSKGQTKTKEQGDAVSSDASPRPRQRWCRKCNAPKPPRAHHCSKCKRYEDARRMLPRANE